jgi:outer membrane protein OmpA-like peptidoglycan-associated protein
MGQSQTGTNLYTHVDRLTQNAASYKLYFLDINSSSSDFSPVAYRSGLVFVSGRKEATAIKRVFTWNDTPFLDLYLLDDVNLVKGKAVASLSGAETSKKNIKREKMIILGRDAYTPLTPNDSRIIANFSSSAYNPDAGYDDAPLLETGQFSKTINTKYHEGPATFTVDGNHIIFTRNNFLNSKYKQSSDKINKLKLYTADLEGNEWHNVRELPFNSDEYSTGHPSLTKDNSHLYFASDRPGGFGGTDIYVAKFENGTWSEPVNLGPEVNTPGNELFPFVDEFGYLYYSSDGKGGLGGLDIFYAKMNTPVDAYKSVNIGAPINSNKDDFGIMTDGERREGYFSSNRRKGGNDDDLYRFVREGPLYPCQELAVQVMDALTKEAQRGVLIELSSKKSEAESRQLKTDEEGKIKFCLDAEEDFVLRVSKKGYQNSTVGYSTNVFGDSRPSVLLVSLQKIPDVETERMANTQNTTQLLTGTLITESSGKPLKGATVYLLDEEGGRIAETVTNEEGQYSFSVKTGGNYSIDALLPDYGTFGRQIVGFDPEKHSNHKVKMFVKGDIIKLENIYYDFAQATLRPDALFELNKLVEIMKKYPDLKIQLSSHTDSRASAKSNKVLSSRRAESVKTYLVGRGIPSTRISARGYGESQLVNECADGVVCPEEKHQQNRRTEIKVVSFR